MAMMKFLVLEDDHEAAGPLRVALEGWDGLELCEVTTVSAVVRTAAAQPFDILILDRMVGDGDGLARSYVGKKPLDCDWS